MYSTNPKQYDNNQFGCFIEHMILLLKSIKKNKTRNKVIELMELVDYNFGIFQLRRENFLIKSIVDDLEELSSELKGTKLYKSLEYNFKELNNNEYIDTEPVFLKIQKLQRTK